MNLEKMITLDNNHTVEAVAIFNNGNSAFILDDRCYVLVNRNLQSGRGDKFAFAYWIFPEAWEVLKGLPSPRDLQAANFQSLKAD
jgi:hypothetical protein